MTKEQRENLKTLADYLDTLPQHAFNMRTYCEDEKGAILCLNEHHCGSVGCAIGHGPLAGIPPLPKEMWGRYAERVFISESTPAYTWCFVSDWADVDNTPQGAAARIRWYLEHGVPDNYEAQLFEGAPLCYKKGEKDAK